jgi:hypothetical protein
MVGNRIRCAGDRKAGGSPKRRTIYLALRGGVVFPGFVREHKKDSPQAQGCVFHKRDADAIM